MPPPLSVSICSGCVNFFGMEASYGDGSVVGGFAPVNSAFRAVWLPPSRWAGLVRRGWWGEVEVGMSDRNLCIISDLIDGDCAVEDVEDRADDSTGRDNNPGI